MSLGDTCTLCIKMPHPHPHLHLSHGPSSPSPHSTRAGQALTLQDHLRIQEMGLDRLSALQDHLRIREMGLDKLSALQDQLRIWQMSHGLWAALQHQHSPGAQCLTWAVSHCKRFFSSPCAQKGDAENPNPAVLYNSISDGPIPGPREGLASLGGCRELLPKPSPAETESRDAG